MGTPLPPIYRDIRRLLVHTEEVVRRFSRYYKYTVGTELRQQAMQLMRCVHRAVYEPAQQIEHVGALVWLIDNYKLSLQLTIEIGACTHSVRLRHALFARFAWLKALFALSVAGDLSPRWVLQGDTFAAQAAALQAAWPDARCQIQKGYQRIELAPLQALPDNPSYIRAVQTGWLRHGTRRREITYWFIPTPIP